MEGNKKTYLVSFGDSDKYRFDVDDPTKTVGRIKEEIVNFLAKKFPGKSMNYLSTPTIEEVPEAEAAKYKPLDASAIGHLKDHAFVGGEVKEALNRLNENAIFDKI